MVPKAASEAGNLEAGFPTSLIDNTTVPTGRAVFGMNLGADSGDVMPDQIMATTLLEVQYGVAPDVQLTAKWPLVLTEGAADGNFDTTVALLWAPVKEQDNVPALGAEVALRAPTGVGKSGWDGSITGIASKKFGEIGTFLNATYTTVGNNDDFFGVNIPRANHTDSFKIGADYMVVDNVCVVADYVNQQSWIGVPGVDRVQLVEVGARIAVTDVDMVSIGTAFGVGNGNATPEIIGTVGYQRLL
jgi:hypothetical protein